MRLGPKTRVVVTGASGTLGWTLCEMLAHRCDVTGTYLSHPCVPEGVRGVELDLGDTTSIRAVVEPARPDIIIHAAAITDPDECENDPEKAFRVNFEATHEIALLAADLGARLVYVSTDLVFDGKKGDYHEEDPPCPLSIYGMSKLRGEEAVLDACPGALVLRSALIYGFGSPTSKTFLGRMLESLSEGRRMQLFTDQMRNPILVDDLAAGIFRAIEEDLSGLYHLGGGEAASRYEFGRRVCQVFGLGDDLLVPVTMDDVVFPAKRPLDATLNTSKFKASTSFVPCDLVVGLARAAQKHTAH